VETPYRHVSEGKVSDKISWFSALEEEGKYIAMASANLLADGTFNESVVSSRLNGNFRMTMAEQIELQDIAPNQMVSVAASLVPFLEHDDANRALMGANMQRQAVPCLRSEAPFVGTTMELNVAMDSGACAVSKHDGIVESVDAERVVVRPTGDEGTGVPDIHHLTKYQRSNQSTCYTQKPLVRPGEVVKAGEVLADGPAVDCGE